MHGLAAAGAGAVQLPADERRLGGIGMRYLLVAPRGSTVDRVVVAVHGIAREWRAFQRFFATPCVAANTALVIPRFSRSGYHGYQRLAVGRRGLAADVALLKVLDDVAERLCTGRLREVRMFGYSGGAQFAHRFALRHPELVKRQALAASGFYSMPDADAPFPYGLGDAKRISGLEPKGLTIPTKVFVGALDVERDIHLRASPELDKQQGRNRVERAQRFVVAVRTLSASRGLVPDCSLEILGDCGHSFMACAQRGHLAEKVVDFLVPESTDRQHLLPPPAMARPASHGSAQRRGNRT